MQELIEIIKKRQEDDEAMPFMYNDKIIALAESLLEKEKEVILYVCCRKIEEFNAKEEWATTVTKMSHKRDNISNRDAR